MSRSSRNRTRDVITPVARPRLRSVTLSSFPSSLRPLSSHLRLFEDRRTWHPLPSSLRVPRTFNSYARLRITPTPRYPRHPSTYPSPSISFVAPQRVVLCVRRQRRREVLHALHKAGRGGQRSPRWTPWSSVRC